MNRKGTMATKQLMILLIGVIFVALCATAFQLFFVDMATTYQVEFDDSNMNFTFMNSSHIENLQSTTQTLESGLNTNVSGDFGFGGGGFFDSSWYLISTPIKAVYDSLALTKDMINGAIAGLIGVPVYIVSGLISIIAIVMVLIVLGWIFNR